MEKAKYYLQKDYFGIKEAGQEKVRKTNQYLLIISSVLLFIIIFYIILYSCTSYSQLDELDDYVNDFSKTNKSLFPEINVGMKIMPSYNTERNILYMEHSNDVSLI